MTKYVGKILIWNYKRLLRKLQKCLSDKLFCHTMYVPNAPAAVQKGHTTRSVKWQILILCTVVADDIL